MDNLGSNQDSSDDLFAQMQQISSSGRRSTRGGRRSSVSSNLGPNIQLVKLNLELNIRSLLLKNGETGQQFNILWIRGTKKIDTKTKTLTNGQVKFGEKFIMKTTLEFDTLSDKYLPKEVSTFNSRNSYQSLICIT